MESIYYAQKAIQNLHGKKVLCETLGPLIVKFAIGELSKYGINMNNANENDAKLFVGSLPKDITEEQIRNIFNRYGTVTEIYIMKNSNNLSKKCAFVTYAFKEQGIFAIQNLNGKIAMENVEKPIEVRFAQSKNQLQEKQLLNRAFMNPLHNNNHNNNNNFNYTHQNPHIHHQLNNTNNIENNNNSSNNGSNNNNNASNNNAYIKSQQFKNMSMNSFNRYPLHMNYNNMQNNTSQQRNTNNLVHSQWKQYFSKEDGSPYYHNELTGQTQWHKPRKVEQDFMNTLNINEVSGPVGANIFIFHIPNEWVHNDLLSAFSPFGNIISAHIATEKNTGRNRGFAFVSYDNVDSALNAIKYMNGFLVHKKKLKVTIKKGEEQYVHTILNQRGVLNSNDNRRNHMNTMAHM
uniref:CUGBP Elav-like family member 2 n=1 Tax=Piliocolobus tephrosceles TaxID=591936 RepID=A0A8C9HZW9_9PRIM